MTKSPLPQNGRIGPRDIQDWFRALVSAADMADADADALIYVISALKVNGAPSEVNTYLKCLQELDIRDDQIVVINQGYETIGQLDVMFKRMSDKDELLILATWTHYLRVRWLVQGRKNVKVRAVFGAPRIKEAVTDAFFTVVFPLIDRFGHMLERIFPNIPWVKGRSEFQRHVISIRMRGEQF